MKMNSASLIAVGLWLSNASAVIIEDVGQLPNKIYDFIIVGGGTAGAVVASRLSENGGCQVLVIEAGPSNIGVMNTIIPGLSGRLPRTIYDWNYTTVPGTGLNNRTLSYPRGHILGGTSSINGMVYTRGSQDDYNCWANITGDPGWSWNNLLPYFFKNERFTQSIYDGSNGSTPVINPSAHGFNGTVITSLPSMPQPIDDRVIEVTRELPSHFPFLQDVNAGTPLGVGWSQATIGNGTRSSSATAYLSESVTTRSNLDVLVNTKVARVLGECNCFTFVEILGSSIIIQARKEVILSAGSINTPQILLNSGIGNKTELEAMNVSCLLNIRDVGKKFVDHPALLIQYLANLTGFWDAIDTNATLQTLALSLWNQNRTGPYSYAFENFMAWSRLPGDSPILAQFGDPSAGPNTPHIEFFPFVRGLVTSPTVGRTSPFMVDSLQSKCPF